MRERRLTIALGLVALGAATPVVYDSARIAFRRVRAGEYFSAIGDIGLILLAGLLAYGAVVYLLARIGSLARLPAAAAGEADAPQPTDKDDDDASLVALVPAYREDPEVILRALLSAALQPRTNRRVVLLIDDHPPSGPTVPASLRGTRELPAYIREMLRPMREYFELALQRFDRRARSGPLDLQIESRGLAELCRTAARWFEAQGDRHGRKDVVCRFFADLTFGVPAAKWLREAQRWDDKAEQRAAELSADSVRRSIASLLSAFRVEISSFERKQFVNLSHVASKAMNVNTYLGLLGGSYRYERSATGLLLSPCSAGCDLVVPDADFALILDADTIVSSDYTEKLMRRFHEPGGERLAVVQSPYSTFPGDRGVLQRTAGAQTDLQYLIHQGLTYYNATYWVGANALVRIAALRELAEHTVERGFPIVKFIRDRTLIEDTETTIDLVARGWRLFNQPERLAFSMTPPDFGSLIIQRLRWASGGVLIIPKLLAYLRQPGSIIGRLREGFMRLHYLISLGPVSMALLVALGISWNKEVRTAGVLGTGLVYYAMYARDLHLVGYRWYDIFRVIALNVILIPVNIIGMLSSLARASLGLRPQFRRTPKVHERTPVPAPYLLAEFGLLALWSTQVALSLLNGAILVAGLMCIHAMFVVYAIGAFIGYRNSLRDISAGARSLVSRRNDIRDSTE